MGKYEGTLDGCRRGNSRGEGQLQSLRRIPYWLKKREICVIHQCINPAPLSPRSMAVVCKFPVARDATPQTRFFLITQTRHRVASRSNFEVIGLDKLRAWVASHTKFYHDVVAWLTCIGDRGLRC